MPELAITIRGKDAASAAVSGLERRFKSLGTTLGKTASIGKSVTKALTGLLAGVAALGAGIAAMVGGQMMIAFLQRAREQSSDFGREMQRLNDIINRVARVVGDILAPVLSLIVDELEKLIPATVTAGEVMESEFGKRVLRFAENALRWGANIVYEFAKGIVEAAKIVIPWALEQVGNLLSYFLAGASPPRIAPDIDKWGESAIGEFLKGMAEADYSTLTDLVGGRLNDALKGLAKSYFGVADAAKAVKRAEEALQASYRATDVATGKLEQLRNEYRELQKAGADPAVLQAKEKEIELAAKSVDESKKATAQAKKDVELAKLLQSLIKPKEAELKGITAVSYTHLRAHETLRYLVCRLLLEKKKEQIREKLADIFKPIKEIWEKDIPALVKIVGDKFNDLRRVFEQVQKFFKATWDPEKGFSANIMDEIVPLIIEPALDAIWETMSEWGRTKLAGVLSDWGIIAAAGLWGLWDRFKIWFMQFGIWLANQIPKWFQSGVDLIQGFIDGIGSMWLKAKKALMALARMLWREWVEFWQIGSPSKKAQMELGMPIGQGIVKGIGQGMNQSTTDGRRYDQRSYNPRYTYNVFDTAAAALVQDQQRRRRLATIGSW